MVSVAVGGEYELQVHHCFRLKTLVCLCVRDPAVQLLCLLSLLLLPPFPWPPSPSFSICNPNTQETEPEALPRVQGHLWLPNKLEASLDNSERTCLKLGKQDTHILDVCVCFIIAGS